MRDRGLASATIRSPRGPHRDRTAKLAELNAARAASDAVFSRCAPDAFSARPVRERHRLIFYVGHLEAFDANLLRHAVDVPTPRPEWDRLFERGIDPVGGAALPTDEPGDWPSLDEVRAYGRAMRDAIDRALARPEVWRRELLKDATLVDAAIEHRLMHVETLAYLMHQLPLGQVAPAWAPPCPVSGPPRARQVEIPAGTATLGTNDGFAWDNERGELFVDVPAFTIDAYPVTNGDYLGFVEAGGYHDPAFWSDDDFGWRDAESISAPRFWHRHGDAWLLRRFVDVVPLPVDAPVYVSHAEASAYARWRNARLPAEAEWHRAAYGAPDADADERRYPWGDPAPDATRGNFDLVRDDAVSVAAHPAGASAFGVHDLLGNGWEWTSTLFAPLPGFAASSFYPGYSADFFDGKHHVMKGGSPRTAARLLRRSFRNWFQPHYPFVYATFRLVEV
jgi:iron(II)-dependent oxidoreductase